MKFDMQLEAEIKALAGRLEARSVDSLESIAGALKVEFKRISEFIDEHYEVIVNDELILAILKVAADMLIAKSISRERVGGRWINCISVYYYDTLLRDGEFRWLFASDEVKKLIEKTQAKQKASYEKAYAETEAKLKVAATELTLALRKALTAYAESRNIEMTEKELGLMKEFKRQYKSYVFDGLSWCCIGPYIEAGHYIIDSLKYAYKHQYKVPNVSCCPPEYNDEMRQILPELKKDGFEAMLDMF